MYAYKTYAKMAKAIKDGKNINNIENRGVIHRDGQVKIFLYDTLVARITKEGIILNNRGWKTQTTKETINAILSMYGKGKVYQRFGKWFYSDKNGKSIEFNDGMTITI